MKKEQKYSDWAKIRIFWKKDTVDAIVLFKNRGYYKVTFRHPRTSTGYVETYTEKQLDKMIAEAAIKDSPLFKALNEREI